MSVSVDPALWQLFNVILVSNAKIFITYNFINVGRTHILFWSGCGALIATHALDSRSYYYRRTNALEIYIEQPRKVPGWIRHVSDHELQIRFQIHQRVVLLKINY